MAGGQKSKTSKQAALNLGVSAEVKRGTGERGGRTFLRTETGMQECWTFCIVGCRGGVAGLEVGCREQRESEFFLVHVMTGSTQNTGARLHLPYGSLSLPLSVCVSLFHTHARTHTHVHCWHGPFQPLSTPRWRGSAAVAAAAAASSAYLVSWLAVNTHDLSSLLGPTKTENAKPTTHSSCCRLPLLLYSLVDLSRMSNPVSNIAFVTLNAVPAAALAAARKRWGLVGIRT